jgi:protein tyrosine phosphatase
MLTAETEGAQRKCHPYWISGDYGPMKVQKLSEKKVSLRQPNTLASNLKRSALGSPLDKPAAAARRRATNPHGAAAADAAARDSAASETSTEPSYITVRTMTLSHGQFPFQPMREIVQIQYTQWPDFGTPAHANDLLGIVEHTNQFSRQYRESKSNPQLPASESDPPVVVHCSAGCGRTGTFCTIDSVIDMLKRQKIKHLSEAGKDGDYDMGNDENREWEAREDVDLVEKSVEDFRLQRISMVQTLKQFVLCYEAVLEWIVKESPERYKKEGQRRSFHG